MNWERNCIRLCAGVLVLSAMLRLTADGFFAPVGRLIRSPESVSFFLWLHTGRHVRTAAPTPPADEPPVKPAAKPERLIFLPEELPEQIVYDCTARPDAQALLTQPLDWSLPEGEEPAVLILHTHGTEAYTPDGDDTYEPSGLCRTLDEGQNMLCLGSLVARRLEEAGIGVIHDRNLHDYPDYNSAYGNASDSIGEILVEHPSIRLILDLHRDAADTAYGQMVTECSIGAQRAAQLMMVVGTGEAQDHPGWEENLSLALKLHALLERENPGICRPLKLSRHRYNQHLGDKALLIEIGAAGNTLREAELAAEALARAVIRLKNGV